MADRVKRILAAVIDWIVTCLPGLVVSLLLYAQMMQGKSSLLILIIFFVAVLSTLPLYAIAFAARMLPIA